MENSTEYYSELIARYFAGEASEKEMEQISVWMNESDENRKLFNEYNKTWNLISKTKTGSEINIDAEWKNIEAKIDFKEEQRPENLKIKLTNNSGKKSFRFLKIAASVSLIFVASYLFYYFLNKNNNVQYIAQNEVVECILPDKSQVTLNNGSIEFRKEFKNRKVNLNGEAFFNVVHDEKKPFCIEAGDIIVEDIGTSFYVNTISSDNNITVVLKEGKVALYKKDKPSEKYFLEPGEKAEYSISGKTFSTSVNYDNNYIAWKTKELIFNDNTLNEIVPLLNKVYHSNITLKDTETGSLRLTAEFKNQSLESILIILQKTLNLTITKSGTGIELSGNGY